MIVWLKKLDIKFILMILFFFYVKCYFEFIMRNGLNKDNIL